MDENEGLKKPAGNVQVGWYRQAMIDCLYNDMLQQMMGILHCCTGSAGHSGNGKC